MVLTREELDEMLRRADEARTLLRRATLELADLGAQIFATRGRAATDDANGTEPR